MNKSQLSIIIPLYNSEKYLSECINSLVNQTYKNIEIIIVNDGSNDTSLEIAQKYKSNDCRVKIISIENQGAATARNIGIDNAAGEYITFVDSDDTVNINAYEYLMSKLQKTDLDILKFNARCILKDQNMAKLPTMEIDFKKAITTEEISKIIDTPVAPWAKIYKKEFLIQNNIKFPDGIIYEDHYFHYACVFSTSKILFANIPLYYYRKTSNTSVTAVKTEKSFDIFKINNLMKEFFKSKDCEKLKPLYLSIFIKSLSGLYKTQCPRKLRKKFFYEMHNVLKNQDLKQIKNKSQFSKKELSTIKEGQYWEFMFIKPIKKFLG